MIFTGTKIMKLVLMFSLLIIVFCNLSIASDDKKKSEVKTEKTYNEEEFKKAVKEEVDKRLLRVTDKKLVELAQELLKKEEALQIRDLELKKSEEELVQSRKTLETKVLELQDRQKKLIGCLDEQDGQKNNRITHMVDVISGMKPDMAAQVLSVQDSEITVQIMGKLDPSKVSKIFNLMDKEISARLQKQYMNMKK